MFQQYITKRHHIIMSSTGIQTPHRCLPFERFKIIQKLILPPDQNPITLSASHQPQSGEVTFRQATTLPPFLALIPAPHPGVDGVCSVLCVDSWWQVHDGSCRKSRKAERGVSTRTRQWHHMISQHEFCFRACGFNVNTHACSQ